MLEDRDYMRQSSSSGWQFRWSMTGALIVALIAAFVLQVLFNRSSLIDYLVLSTAGLKSGYIWQLVTFQFLHGGAWHLLGNLIALWFLGRSVEQRFGSTNLMKIFILCGVAGGILEVCLGFFWPGTYGGGVVGASAGTAGLLAAFALAHPEGIILVSFVFPIRAKYLFWGSLVIAFIFTLAPPDDGIAHAAHLGGLLFGWFYIWAGLHTLHSWAEFNPFRSRDRKRRLVKAASVRPNLWRQPKGEPQEPLPPTEFISKEVDPILDKISAHGIQSLTERERKILEAARSRMAQK